MLFMVLYKKKLTILTIRYYVIRLISIIDT